jgi:hypothetical protein
MEKMKVEAVCFSEMLSSAGRLAVPKPRKHHHHHHHPYNHENLLFYIQTYLPTSPHGVTVQKNNVDVITTVRTYNLK